MKKKWKINPIVKNEEIPYNQTKARKITAKNCDNL